MAYRILAAVDLGPMAERVLGSAAVLARAQAAELHVRHVSENGEPDHPAAVGARERDEELLRLLTRAFEDGVITSVRVLTGRPADAIAAAAAEVDADMIVLGPHAGSDLGARLLGTTADRVLRRARVPCLVVRQRLDEAALQRLVVPTDFSAAAAAAAAAAGDLARRVFETVQLAPEVRLLHVGWPDGVQRDAELKERSLLARMADTAQTVRDVSGREPRLQVSFAQDIAAGILEQADGGIIIMGSTGASGVRSLLLGSVAARVARRATVPVLLVPLAATTSRARREPRLDCVVTGTDFSAAALGAVEWVSNIAPDARHVLVHAVQVPDAIDYAGDAADVRSRLIDDLCAEAEARLDELHPAATHADRRIAVGRGAEELARAALECAADVVAIGGHTHPRGLWSVLGTTAEQLIRSSPVPVLIVRGRPRRGPRSIIASVDGSAQSVDILAWARMLAQKHGASLDIVHVLSARYLGAARMVSGMRAAREFERSAEEQAMTWLDELAQHAGLEAGSYGTVVTTGEPAWELLALQSRLDADLLIVGSRGAGAVGRTLIGSVSYAVIRGATCPVLVIRGGDNAD